MKAREYFLTPTGKIGTLVKVTASPDIYHLDIEGKIIQYRPNFLSRIPESKLALFSAHKHKAHV